MMKALLLYGTDLDGIYRLIREIEADNQTERITISAEDTKVEEIITHLDSQSLFSPSKLLVIKDCDKLSAKEIEKILAHHNKANSEDRLIFTSARLDGKSSQVKGFAKNGTVKECNFETGLPLKRRIEKTFTDCGVEAGHSVIELLMSISLNDPKRALEFAQQMALFCSDSGKITSADVDQFIASSPEGNLFKMIDSLFSGKKQLVYSSFEHLIRGGEEPSKILFMIVRHLKILLAISNSNDRKTISDTAKQFRIPGFAVNNYVTQSRRFSRSRLVEAFNLAQESDWQLKGGGALSDSQTVGLLLSKILNLD